jgi:hypothetical protein
MRTLFISDTIPYPPNNGKRQRIYHLLRGVARGSEVTLVAPVQRNVPVWTLYASSAGRFTL